jgi:gamma-glutamyltranspeptidase / glutathione hydrolase
MRDFHLPGRSPVLALNGMAATHNPHASRVAIEILKAGGNALDAAVATAAVLAVIEPQQTGIGGDCFVIYAKGGRDNLVCYNGSGRAPMAASAQWFAERGITGLADTSPHAVTVPGAIEAWTRLIADHGSKTMAELLAPAIEFAERGYPVHQVMAHGWAANEARLRGDANAARVFLPRGRAMQEGEVFRNPGLAEALRLVAKHGRDGFYKGRVAEDIAGYLHEIGGLHTIEDFAGAKGEYVEPVRCSYRGLELCQIPPNNQGLTALLMLNILEGFDLSTLKPASAERLHLEIEAGRLAYRDRDAFIADQRFAKVPIKELLSKDYAAKQRKEIMRDRAMTHLPPLMRQTDTVYITVVDKDRNAASFINSVYWAFGAARVSPKYGILLQNRGLGFSLDPSHPNAIAGGKRPLHTIMPGMALKDSRVHLSFGVMGGDYQPFGQIHVLTGIADFGMDVQEAIDQPRVFPDDGIIYVERGVPAATVAGLARMGHAIAEAAEPFGGGHCIRIDWQEGVLMGGSDGRKDGAALGY